MTRTFADTPIQDVFNEVYSEFLQTIQHSPLLRK